MAKPNRGGLGRGLDALIPSGPPKEPEAPTIIYIEKEGSRDFFFCPIEKISPSVEQPRQHIDDVRLTELAESIKAQGIIQHLAPAYCTHNYVYIFYDAFRLCIRVIYTYSGGIT